MSNLPSIARQLPASVKTKKKKTVIVIDKHYFLLCKKFLMERANDENYSNLLKIPIEKVKFFKRKMQMFEKNLRARRKKVVELEPQRRGPKPKKKPLENKSGKINTKEMRIENHKKARQVRDLILDSKNNKEIAENLGVNRNFVARLRLRMFRQKMQLVEKGELEVGEDELDFKYLSYEMKAKRIAKLLEEGHRAVEIGRMLKIDERSVNRWRTRIKEIEKNPDKFKLEPKEPEKKPQDYLPRYRQSIEKSLVDNTKQLLECGLNYRDISKTLGITMSTVMRIKKAILTNTIDEIIDDTAERIKENVLMKKSGLIESDDEEFKPRPRRKRRGNKSGKIEIKNEPESESENYSEDDNDWNSSASSDFDEDSSNADIKFENDDHKVKIEKEEFESDEDFDDPLIEPEISINEIIKPEIRRKLKKSPKKPRVKKFYPRETLGNKPLSDKDAILAKKLLDNGIRRVDIAVMLETTEKAVSKLLDRSQGLNFESVDPEINELVENFLQNKEKYKGVQKSYGEIGIVIHEKEKKRKKVKRKLKDEIIKEPERVKDESYSDDDAQLETKRQTALRLLSVNVKISDIVKMLNVSEQTVMLWKSGKSDENPSAKNSSRPSGDLNKIFKANENVKSEPFDDDDDYGDFAII